jgi:glutaredoxin
MRIIIYSKDQCPYCDNARDLLKRFGKEYIEYKLDKDFSRAMIKEVFPTAKTFPIITLDKTYIGGYNDLCEIAKEW